LRNRNEIKKKKSFSQDSIKASQQSKKDSSQKQKLSQKSEGSIDMKGIKRKSEKLQKNSSNESESSDSLSHEEEI